jgi:hypothetical protein
MDEWKNKMSSVYTLEATKKNKRHIICRKIDGTEDYHVEHNKPDSERQILHLFFICRI